MVNLIAEIGWNHMGDLNLIEKMVIEASSSGAQFAKFQTWHEKNLIPGPWDHDGRREIYKKAELTIDQFSKVKEICDSNNISFLTSVFFSKDLEDMSKISNKAIKIPSHEIANKKLIREATRYFKKIYLSTGASTEIELYESLELLKMSKVNFTLMHCVSSYPCNDNVANLQRIDKLKEKHHSVGFSDHSPDILPSIIALGKNIEVIEKHFTIDKSLPGRDNAFAILPKQLNELSNIIKRFNSFNVDHGMSFQECEGETVEKYRGRWGKEDYS